MVIAIVGAGGFLGKHLVNYLLKHTDYSIKAISHSHATTVSTEPLIYSEPQYAGRVSLVEGDVFDEDGMTDDLAGVDVAFYFVHMMGQKREKKVTDKTTNFYKLEAQAARLFGGAVAKAGVKRVVYMGGLGDDRDKLLAHLASRHNTGKILRQFCPLVIEFRASMIIGQGSVAFDIIDNLVRKLPVMGLPPCSSTLTQPIALADALEYLEQSISRPFDSHQVIEIGGPTALSYKDLYRQYARWLNKHPVIIRLPFIPVELAAHWLNFFTPKVHARIGRAMVDSMNNAMVADETLALKLFPDIKPRSLQAAFDDIKPSSHYDKKPITA